jgi:hypothetical protein
VFARFRPINYAIRLEVLGDGNADVSVSGKYNLGETITVTITPEAGFVVDTISAVNDTTNGIISVTKEINGDYTFVMQASNVTITITMVEQE